MKLNKLLSIITVLSFNALFSQNCTPFEIPFQEGFNSDSATESCWTVLNLNNDTDTWNLNYTTNPFEGNQTAVIITDFNNGLNNDWLISPTITISGNSRLRFKYRVQSSNEPNDFRVMISVNGTNPTNFETLVPLASYSNTTYQEMTVNLATFQGDVNLAWHVPQGGLDGWRLYIDDVIVEEIPSCIEPLEVNLATILPTSVEVSWLDDIATEHHILALPCGSPAPSASDTGFIVTTTNPTVITGLTPNTCYDFYVRAVCNQNDISVWSNRVAGTTQLAPPECGGQFTDNGGLTANYLNNSNITTTICPDNAGEFVTVAFTAFDTEATWDGLYVYDGNSVTNPQIASTNNAGNSQLTMPGAFWGTVIPGPFSSTSPDGCLTFKFLSDSSGTKAGWVADITCAPYPACKKPNGLYVSNITATSALLNWNQLPNPDTSVATEWEYLVLPCGVPQPTDATAGVSTSSNPLEILNLEPNTCYDVYVRAVCNETTFSEWSAMVSFQTLCSTITLPLIETFNSNSTTEDCWTVLNENNDNDSWNLNYTFNPFEGNQSAILFTDGNNGNNNDWLISPQVSLTGNQRLRYRYRVQSATEPNDFRVMLSTTGINPADFTETLVPLTSYNNIQYLETTVDLGNYTGIVNIAFHVPSGNIDGWRLYIDRVIIEENPTCFEPNTISTVNTTTTSAEFSWTDNNSTTPQQWELLVLPFDSPEPEFNLPVGTGNLVTSNPATILNLSPTTQYILFIRVICSDTDKSNWSQGFVFNTLPSNDECIDAIVVPVNSSSTCNQIVYGTISNSSASIEALPAVCNGTADDDVWFQFTATANAHTIALKNIVGSTTNLNHAVYTGECTNLTPLYCSYANENSSLANNLTVGQTYFIRIYSNSNVAQTVNFNICISTPPTCSNANKVCGSYSYGNAIGVDSLGTIGCLTSSPNATFFNLKVAESGPINFLLTQSTTLNGNADLDVDYVAWGPFTSQEIACDAVSGGALPLTGSTTGCSYSAAPTENFNITNAQAGQHYILLVTNFSNDPGFITITQTNVNQPGAGSINCDGIRLNAFIDNNNNGIQEASEFNFPLGQFHYEMNNDGIIHNIISPTGRYTIFDTDATNNYNLNYSINSDYSSMYSVNTSYSNVNVTNGGLTTYNFPVTIVQNYNDIAVSMAPVNAPRAGITYQNKITITNNGNQTIASGVLTFTRDNSLTINNVAPTGSSINTNGFTYPFSNLLPFESRTLMVTLNVPTIPNVSIGQLLTNSVNISFEDTVTENNSSSLTQAIIAAYDPNDKTESHGEKILFSSFNEGDYLDYTIRFENTGNIDALDVVVTDLIDEKLDETSLIMLSSSHNYTLDRVENLLTWTFKDIQLPVSVPNSTIGKGYINFKIKPKPGFAVGDIIPNTANIYFDTNPAIITNTFNTEFVQTLGNTEFNATTINLYPNPAKESFTIHNFGTETIGEISIYEVSGKKVFSQTKTFDTLTTITISDFAKGIYLVEIISKNKAKLTKKLIIE